LAARFEKYRRARLGRSDSTGNHNREETVCQPHSRKLILLLESIAVADDSERTPLERSKRIQNVGKKSPARLIVRQINGKHSVKLDVSHRPTEKLAKPLSPLLHKRNFAREVAIQVRLCDRLPPIDELAARPSGKPGLVRIKKRCGG
jgi:hypothetical protein